VAIPFSSRRSFLKLVVSEKATRPDFWRGLGCPLSCSSGSRVGIYIKGDIRVIEAADFVLASTAAVPEYCLPETKRELEI